MNEEYSKEVIRVERWGGWIIAVWTLVGRQMVCILSEYAPQAGRTQEDKDAFRSNLEEIILLREEGVTQDNLHKWEQQNRDRSADCQKLSAEQG